MIRQFALLAGFAWLIVGFLSFLPGLLVEARGPTGLWLGLVPASPLLNALHIVLGFAGVSASGHYLTARTFARALSLTLAALALLGLAPITGQFEQLAPLTLDATFSHGLFAMTAAYFGWGAPSRSFISML